MERTALKVFRVKHKMSQEEFADKIGVVRSTYQSIESGARNGRKSFWDKLQKAFNVDNSDMWELMKRDEE